MSLYFYTEELLSRYNIPKPNIPTGTRTVGILTAVEGNGP